MSRGKHPRGEEVVETLCQFLSVRKGEVLDDEVIVERSRNIAMYVLDLVSGGPRSEGTEQAPFQSVA